MFHVLVVCKGNICRSPFAETVIRTSIEKRGVSESLECRSRGTENYHVGKGADSLAIKVAREFGYDLTRHIATQVTDADLSWADLVLVFEPSNRDCLLERVPQAVKHNIQSLAEYLDPPRLNISDPYRKLEHEFRACFSLILAACNRLVQVLCEKPAPIR